ncbi:DinB family protein [Acidobacteria bacterium AB60]|nr:DinB family protein [Acidobacteria bacterium AB60]
MGMMMPADIADLVAQLDAAERDLCRLLDGLTPALGGWRPASGAWSAAECLEHLAITNRVYLGAMQEPAVRARTRGNMRRGPVKPGVVGGWFARSLEPPVKPGRRTRAPRMVVPATSTQFDEAAAAFSAAHAQVRAYLLANADLDLNRMRFPNPFVRGIRFSVATGLQVIAAHERRHLWQAWRTRRAAESDSATSQ